jgi:hypothetical protein
MMQCDDQQMQKFLAFIFNAPADEEIIDMDCNDHCEELARLAEQVASGADIRTLLPALEEHMRYWTDCREEFEALVAILRAEKATGSPE